MWSQVMKNQFQKFKSSYNDDAVIRSMNKAYHSMYFKWVRIGKRSRKKSSVSRYFNWKVELKSDSINLQNIVLGKEEKLRKVSIELESTHKSLRIMNFRTKLFDQILTMGKACSD